MSSDTPADRLTEIPTRWEEVRLAQTGTAEKAQDARDALCRRYAGAVRRYLLAALSDPPAAEDLTQEFAVAVLEGKIKRADPEHGRFRDYIKGILFHLVSQYRRRQKKQPVAAPADLEELADVRTVASEKLFDQSWRDELLARAWAGLAEAQPNYFTVLHFRSAHPDMPAEQMLAELATEVGKPLTADNLRQILHRARKVFADALLREVAQSLADPTLEAVQQELYDLELASYFRGNASAFPEE
jgi:RNA polymerase sigma factor (sigma-70 family)